LVSGVWADKLADAVASLIRPYSSIDLTPSSHWLFALEGLKILSSCSQRRLSAKILYLCRTVHCWN